MNVRSIELGGEQGRFKLGNRKTFFNIMIGKLLEAEDNCERLHVPPVR